MSAPENYKAEFSFLARWRRSLLSSSKDTSQKLACNYSGFFFPPNNVAQREKHLLCLMTESMSKSWCWKEKSPTEKVHVIIHCDSDNPANFPTSKIILPLEARPLCCIFSFYETSVLWKISAAGAFFFSIRSALPCQRTAVGPCGTSSCCRLQLWRRGWCRGWCRPSGTSCTCHLGCRL